MKCRVAHFYFIAFALLLCFINRPVLSQKIIFNKIVEPELTPNELISGIVQDQQGYMWFSSKKGLYRYDGYHITAYRNNPLNSNSIATNLLESICVDSSGNIWIGTLGTGLEKLDPVTGIFTHFRYDAKQQSGLSNDTVAALLCDKDGMLWIGTHNGLDRLDVKTKRFTHYRYNKNDSSTISNNLVRSLYVDRRQTLWIGTGSPYPDNGGTPEDGGLNRFDGRTGKFIRYLHEPGNSNSLVNNKVRAMYEDTKGNFWVGTGGDGLHIMDRTTGTFKRYPYDPYHPEKLSRPPVSKSLTYVSYITFIKEDAAGKIWISSSDAGINYYDPETHYVKYYRGDSDSSGGFSGIAWAAYTSRDGMFWVSTMQGHLFTVDPFQKTLPRYPTSSAVSSFYQQSDSILWIGSMQGLIRRNRNDKTVKIFAHDPLDPTSLSNNMVMSIQPDLKGKIWVGTRQGLNAVENKNGIFRQYKHDNNIPGSLKNDFIVPIYEDPQNNFWIGTLRGLNLMDRKTGTFRHYIINETDTNNYELGPNLVTSVIVDNKRRLWIGAWGGSGINQLDKQTGVFKNFLKGVNITALCQDGDGKLWAGSEDGLYYFDEQSQIFIRFIDPSSLAGIADVISMVEDDRKSLWLGSSDGIIKINPQRNETTIYGDDYGVKANSLIYTSAYKGLKSELFFGDTSGYFAFSPDHISKYSTPPEILLTAFRIANKPVQPANSAPFKGPLWKTQQIHLNHSQNVFSFDFIAIDYKNPKANRSLYILENYDNDWRMGENNNRAYYFNVPPGKYIFKIKSANSDGVWAQKDILIILTPPWWRTWWAYMLFATIIVSIIWGIIYYRSKSLIKDKHELEAKVKSRTAEIVKQKEEIATQRDSLKQAIDELKTTQTQLIQREKMASLGELTAGVAHEIQNPLNFINNFSEVNTELITELKDEIKKGNLTEVVAIADSINENEKKISHHGKRADAIVKGMLHHSGTNNSSKELTDINALTDEYLRLGYHGFMAKDKSLNANLITDYDGNIGKINIISQDIGRVLLNLFTNAFYAVTKASESKAPGYIPTVSVSTKKTDGKIEISVKDNGNGISQNILHKIYQPFFTTKSTGQGTGLGLSLSYDIVKAHGGEIKVNTKEGEFAEFIIQLPA